MITEVQKEEIWKCYEEGDNISAISNRVNVDRKTVRNEIGRQKETGRVPQFRKKDKTRELQEMVMTKHTNKLLRAMLKSIETKIQNYETSIQELKEIKRRLLNG